MDKIIYESKYVIVKMDEENSLKTTTYLPETENITDEDWTKLMTVLVDVTYDTKPIYIIDDNRQRRYNYSPDTQEWMAKLFIDCWREIGVKMYAQIMPEDIIGKITSEQIETVANEIASNFKIQGFFDMGSAKKWIYKAIKSSE